MPFPVFGLSNVDSSNIGWLLDDSFRWMQLRAYYVVRSTLVYKQRDWAVPDGPDRADKP